MISQYIFYFRCADARVSYKDGNFTIITLNSTNNMSYLESGIFEEKNNPCFYQIYVPDNNKTVFKEFQCTKWVHNNPHGKVKTWSDQVCFLKLLLSELSARPIKRLGNSAVHYKEGVKQLLCPHTVPNCLSFCLRNRLFVMAQKFIQPWI